MKYRTVVQIEIEHDKPLPTRQNICDIAASRVYGWLYSEGCESGVTAKRMSVQAVDRGQPDTTEGTVCDV